VPSHIAARVALFAVTLTLALPAAAAQIVALDLQAQGNAPKRLAQALSPLLIAELARREGMSVISQDDVRALLELEAEKQLVGCDDAGCMADIAGSLGAELLCSSKIALVGKEYVVSLTLLQVDGAKVVRRSTGRAKGGEEVASEAVLSAVHELFRGELPTDLQGPASMTGRGFEAALAGLRSAILSMRADPKPVRKRVILDLVNTELDYDAEPKMKTLDLEIRRGRSEARRRALASSSARERDHFVKGMAIYNALWDDLGRVKEIRTRARERGIVPSARPLRFLDADPIDEPTASEKKAYLSNARAARKVLQRALFAYAKNDEKGFAALWKKGYESNAKRELESGRAYDLRKDQRWDVLPVHAHTPDLLQRGVSSMAHEKGAEEKIVVYRRRWRDKKIVDEDTVYLVKEDGKWKISSW
jgi:hypothetical protein